MEKIRIYESFDQDFGKCVVMENDHAKLWVTIDFGPRILHYSRAGMDNILYQDKSKKPLGEVFPEYEGDVLRLYGGHRLWISPEALPRCYHPDNKPVEYKETPGRMEFIAPVEKHTGLQKSLTISLSEDCSRVSIVHKITNHSLWPVQLAPWALTMMSAGGVAVIPSSGPPTGLLPNRLLALWDYTDLNDKRLAFGKKCIMAQQKPDVQHAVKLGLYSHSGYAAYFNRGQLFIKDFEVMDGHFPDFGCNYEMYTGPDFLESETLGPLTTLESGQSVLHNENWRIFAEDAMPEDEDAALEIIGKYAKNS